MHPVYLVDGARTPFGRADGALSDSRPDDLAALVLKTLTSRFALPAATPVILGCANQAGEDCRNIARLAALIAGLPEETPAWTINQLCGSGLLAVLDGARQIKLGEASTVIAGGVESASRAPLAHARDASELADTRIGWRFTHPEMTERYGARAMAVTVDLLAQAHGVTRAAQDDWVIQSHRRALDHQAEHQAECLAVGAVTSDETPRDGLKPETLARLKPLPDCQMISPGNAAGVDDGAACVRLSAHPETSPLLPQPVQLVDWALTATHPDAMALAPISAIQTLLSRQQMALDEINAWEIHEAFAAQVLLTCHALDINPQHPGLNAWGGALALGNPMGAAGARLILTLARRLSRHASGTGAARYGIAAMPVGLGQGIAVLLKAG